MYFQQLGDIRPTRIRGNRYTLTVNGAKTIYES